MLIIRQMQILRLRSVFYPKNKGKKNTKISYFLRGQRDIFALHEKLAPKLIHEHETDVKNDSSEKVGSAVISLVPLGGTKTLI